MKIETKPIRRNPSSSRCIINRSINPFHFLTFPPRILNFLEKTPMASFRLSSLLLLRSSSTTTALFQRSLLHHKTPIFTSSSSRLIDFLQSQSQSLPIPSLGLRFFSTARRQPQRPITSRVDIGARARQLQNRRLWTYALTFSCIAGFIVIVLNTFQDQLVFYVTPTDALEKYSENPSKTKFRLGGLVLEGSVVQPASSPEMEFVITDLITDILVRYQGSLPDLFREGHSVVVEGFVKPITDEIKKEVSPKTSVVSGKARNVDCYFSATEVLAKHDEKYMPQEVASAIEKNKKKLLAAQEEEARSHNDEEEEEEEGDRASGS